MEEPQGNGEFRDSGCAMCDCGGIGFQSCGGKTHRGEIGERTQQCGAEGVQWRGGIWGVVAFELVCCLLADVDEVLDAGLEVCRFVAEAKDHAEECGEAAEDIGR